MTVTAVDETPATRDLYWERRLDDMSDSWTAVLRSGAWFWRDYVVGHGRWAVEVLDDRIRRPWDVRRLGPSVRHGGQITRRAQKEFPDGGLWNQITLVPETGLLVSARPSVRVIYDVGGWDVINPVQWPPWHAPPGANSPRRPERGWVPLEEVPDSDEGRVFASLRDELGAHGTWLGHDGTLGCVLPLFARRPWQRSRES